MVQQHREGILVSGGDLNMALDPMRDSSKGSSHLSYVKLRKVKKLLQDLQLIDSWKAVHAQDRDYTFFSAKHKTYTRIDYVLVSQNIITSLIEASSG